MAWPRAIEWHFWLAVGGTLVYVVSMWNAGITQGLMWRAYDQNGALSYSFVESVQAMAPYYLIRTIGGGMFLTGAAICALNCYATFRSAPYMAEPRDVPLRPTPAE
jgi:cytochrome c oxidase cbb3-type subunit 1